MDPTPSLDFRNRDSGQMGHTATVMVFLWPMGSVGSSSERVLPRPFKKPHLVSWQERRQVVEVKAEKVSDTMKEGSEQGGSPRVSSFCRG